VTYPNNGYPTYRCGHIEYKPYRRLCYAPQIRTATLEEAAWKPIWGLLTDPEELWRQGNAYNDGQRKPGESAKAQNELTRLRRQQENIVKLIRRGRLDADEGERDLKALDTQIAERERRLSAFGKVIELPPEGQLEKQMAKIYDPRNEPQTYQERRLVLEGLRDLRMNYYKGDLEITGSVPVAAAKSADVGRSRQKNCHSSLGSDAQGQ
jgi:hypothetical protein